LAAWPAGIDASVIGAAIIVDTHAQHGCGRGHWALAYSSGLGSEKFSKNPRLGNQNMPLERKGPSDRSRSNCQGKNNDCPGPFRMSFVFRHRLDQGGRIKIGCFRHGDRIWLVGIFEKSL
jgi:hypothetical protein